MIFVHDFLFYVLSVCVYVNHEQIGARGSQDGMSEPLEVELPAFVSHLIWVLGTKPGSSARASNAPNQWAIFLTPTFMGFIYYNNQPGVSWLHQKSLDVLNRLNNSHLEKEKKKASIFAIHSVIYYAAYGSGISW